MLQLVFNKEMGLSCSINRDYRPIYGNSWVNVLNWDMISGASYHWPLGFKKGEGIPF